MRVLFVASELYPLIKTGGLADVCGALPPALAGHDIEVRTLLPAYPVVRERLGPTRPVAEIDNLFGGRARLAAGVTPEGVRILALEAPHLYGRAGNPYLGPDGKDWPDNHFRFAALSWVASEIGLGRLGDWRPDVVHGHDWQAGLAPAYLAFAGGARPATLLTIHNLAFQGLFPVGWLEALRLPAASFAVDGVEFHGQIGLLKAGLYYADAITTVSPTYAREIMTVEDGAGLDGLLRARADDVHGILNGLDELAWDPSTDKALPATYGPADLAGKAVDKARLQHRFDLDGESDAPLFCVISRLTQQKGLDLLLEALPALVASGAQLALLGSGDAALEAGFVSAARRHRGRIGTIIGYDEPLSHLLQAGADAIIVPSRFEPCGLTQLAGLRYGTIPLVARVGGLADTVIDANDAAMTDGVATGVQFAPVTTAALIEGMRRLVQLHRDSERWNRMVLRAMTRDVGWRRSAARYAALYHDLVARRGRAS
jgi:starch synthase